MDEEATSFPLERRLHELELRGMEEPGMYSVCAEAIR